MKDFLDELDNELTDTPKLEKKEATNTPLKEKEQKTEIKVEQKKVYNKPAQPKHNYNQVKSNNNYKKRENNS